MSATHADKIAERLGQSLLTVAWRQWRTLGMTISGVDRDAQCAVDPEALLLVTPNLVVLEPRLKDVIISWLTERSTAMSVGRLRRMARQAPPAMTALLPTLARVAFEEGKDYRWKPLLKDQVSSPEIGGRGRDLLAERTYRPSGAIMIQLRSGMGVSVKADVLAYLLCVSRSGQDWASISAIQEALGYTKLAITRAAEEMSAAHFISSPGSVDRHKRPPRMYRAEQTGWANVLGLNSGMPEWTPWEEHFRFATTFIEWRYDTKDRAISEYALATKLRSLQEAHPRALVTGRSDAERAPDEIDKYLGYFDRHLAQWENWVVNQA